MKVIFFTILEILGIAEINEEKEHVDEQVIKTNSEDHL
jgi:hypothetical protein